MTTVVHVPTAPPVPLLAARGLTVRYGPLVALEGIDLEVAAGELVVVAGESGAGKTTLLRCVAGEVVPAAGDVVRLGEPVVPSRSRRAHDVGIVWQDLALCENLSIADNLALGRERRFLLRSDARVHRAAAETLARFGVRSADTTRNVRSLTRAQRQLLAVARAMLDAPRLLILDEPTGALGAQETAEVEQLIERLHRDGTTILLVSHDLDQMFRLGDRIVVLRNGRLVAEVDPRRAHHEDVVSLMSGQPVDSSARGQLTRLHGLADRLASADRSSSLSLILSTLAAALNVEHLAVHLADGDVLRCAEAVGVPAGLRRSWDDLAIGAAGGPVGLAAATGQPVVVGDARTSPLWAPRRSELEGLGVASSWSVPLSGPGGLLGVVSALRSVPAAPGRDELDLVSLYAGYLAGALERERLFGEVTRRNRVLETVREILQALTGPMPFEQGLATALRALRSGLEAAEVALVMADGSGEERVRVAAGPAGAAPVASALLEAATAALRSARPGELVRRAGGGVMAIPLAAPGGDAALVASWHGPPPGVEGGALLVDAASSLSLALEREAAAQATQETAALRRSRELQRAFLSRLGHELRTPLTGIRGYASSLLQPDVTWDGDSERRFLSRIASESARLGRLVDDLLEFSVIESGILRLSPDWCDLGLVLEAAAACIPLERAGTLRIEPAADLPAVWADHDRLEQVFVNLLDNALRHNPPGTSVAATASAGADGQVVVEVRDDGPPMLPEVAAGLFEPGRRRFAPTAGTGLGLLIANGIVAAHGGHLELVEEPAGKRFLVVLPVEPHDAHDHEPAGQDAWRALAAPGTAGRP